MRISDWSSDVCSSDLDLVRQRVADRPFVEIFAGHNLNSVRPERVEGLFLSLRRKGKDGASTNSAQTGAGFIPPFRSEERRVGKECVCTCKSRWSPYH